MSNLNKDSRENREISLLVKNFRGMKERFKDTSASQFKEAAELFMDNLCTAYDLNDFRLNEAAIKAHNEVCEILEERLNSKDTRNRTMVWHFTMVLKAFMERFYIQAGRQYD